MCRSCFALPEKHTSTGANRIDAATRGGALVRNGMGGWEDRVDAETSTDDKMQSGSPTIISILNNSRVWHENANIRGSVIDVMVHRKGFPTVTRWDQDRGST